MEFRVLGPFEVRRDGRLIEVRGSKRRVVLALLVLQANEVVRTDRLIEELWGDQQPANAPAALHNHVSRLRKDVGDDVLVTKPWGYVLRAAPDAVDLRRFESLVAEARPLPASERNAKLGEALALWRGPALADLANEPALIADCGRIDELRQSVVEQRIDARLELGEHADLIPELERLVAEHPLRERLRGQLILALYRSGRQAEALETYRETRRVLVEELGIEPSSELRELERAILRQDPALASVGSASEPERVDDPPPSRWRWPRSPLMVGAAVLLAVAGAAVATLATPRSGTPHADAAQTPASSPEAKPGSTSTPPPAVVVVRRNQKPKRHRPLPARRREPPAAGAKGSAGAETTAKPAKETTTTTTKPVRAEPPPPNPPPTAKPKPKPNPPPATVYWLTDDFADAGFDHGMWHLASHGSGVETAERNGRVEFSISPDAVLDPEYGVDQHYGTQCELVGDFEATVEFELLTWPAANGVNVTFGAYFPRPYRGVGWLAIQRAGARTYDKAPEAYDSNIAYGAGAQTDDRSGALRLKRSDGTLSTYYRYRGSWVRLGSKSAPLPAVLVLNFNSGGTPAVFGGQTASAAFDNFSATAEDVNCQGHPVPPRKRL